MAEIRAESGYLYNLSERLDDISSDLNLHSRLSERGVSCSSGVTDAFGDLAGKWDVHRKKLTELLDALAAGFRVAAEGFEEADSRLAEQATEFGNAFTKVVK